MAFSHCKTVVVTVASASEKKLFPMIMYTWKTASQWGGCGKSFTLQKW